MRGVEADAKCGTFSRTPARSTSTFSLQAGACVTFGAMLQSDPTDTPRMATPHVSTPEDHSEVDRSRPKQTGSPRRSSYEMAAGSASSRPRPRTRPPSFKSSPPAATVIESQSLTERLLPPLFFGFLVLVVAGSIALLLWTPDSSNDYDLTSEELRVLNGEVSPRTPETVGPNRADGSTNSVTAAGTASADAVLEVETTPSGAVVAIDGEVAGVTPLRRSQLSARWHIVSVESPGFAAKDTLVYLDAGVPTTISLTLIPSASDAPAAVSSPDLSPGAPETVPEPPAAASADPVVETPSASAPASGSITVAVNPSGVPVQLDGQTVGVAPMELSDVSPGTHTLTFFLPGYETATVRIDVAPGAREVVDISLVPQTGTLTVVARPWGSIYVDGRLRAEDTDVSVEVTLPVGTHQVRVEHPTLGAQERTVEVRPDRTTSEVFDLN